MVTIQYVNKTRVTKIPKFIRAKFNSRTNFSFLIAEVKVLHHLKSEIIQLDKYYNSIYSRIRLEYSI